MYEFAFVLVLERFVNIASLSKTGDRRKTLACICTVYKNRHHADVSKEHIILTGFIDVIFVCVRVF